jgi:hypothetical protein
MRAPRRILFLKKISTRATYCRTYLAASRLPRVLLPPPLRTSFRVVCPGAGMEAQFRSRICPRARPLLPRLLPLPNRLVLRLLCLRQVQPMLQRRVPQSSPRPARCPLLPVVPLALLNRLPTSLQPQLPRTRQIPLPLIRAKVPFHPNPPVARNPRKTTGTTTVIIVGGP